MPDTDRLRVVIAGGGVAGAEAALALKDLAGDRVETTLLSPSGELVYRPMAVREPFAYAKASRYSTAEIAAQAGAVLVRDEFAWVEPRARIAHTRSRRQLPYDALLIAMGARLYDPFPHAHTVSDRNMEESLHGLVQDLELGYIRKLAFVMPPGTTWPLPLYELALLTGSRAYAMNIDADITIVTPERMPLEIFGRQAAAAVSGLLTERRIGLETHAQAHVPDSRTVIIEPGDRTLEVDRVIALPELMGPSVRGLKGTERGFVPIGPDCRVTGWDNIFAVGDATDYPIKHGGLSAQQADTAAAEIARMAGADVEVKQFRPVIRGLMLTGRDPLYFEAKIVGGGGFESRFSKDPLWSPPTKISAAYLGPLLDQTDKRPSHA